MVEAGIWINEMPQEIRYGLTKLGPNQKVENTIE
jgi:hypothetical protein